MGDVLSDKAISNKAISNSDKATPYTPLGSFIASILGPLANPTNPAIKAAQKDNALNDYHIDLIKKIRIEASLDDAEALARLFESSLFKDNGLVTGRLETILSSTKYFKFFPLHTALEFHDKGFKADFKDPYPSSDNQVGHFLTAVSFSYNPYQISWLRGGIGADSKLSDVEVSIRLAIGHELYPDPGWWDIASFIFLPAKVVLSPNILPDDAIDVFANQYQATNPADVTAFQNALAALTNPNNPLVINLSAAIPYLKTIETRIKPNSKGNSVQDLRLTLLGWHLAQEIIKGKFRDRMEVAKWLRLNLHT